MGLKDLQDLSLLDVALGLVLGEHQLAIDAHIEDALTAGNDAQIFDHVLIITEQFVDYAHGIGGVVSGYAVGDLDSIFGHAWLQEDSL